MKPFWVMLLGLMLSPFVIAEDEEKELPPLDPIFMGSQKMVLAVGGQNLFALNLVTHKRPANVQIIYELSTKDPALFYLVRDADLVSMKMKPFNLERLMRGEEVSVKADIYMGHFDEAGMLTYKNRDITFTKQHFVRDLATDIPLPSSQQREYLSVDLRGNERLLVHKVQGAPSYQHLIFFHESLGCVTNFTSSSAVPPEGEILSRLSLCGSMKPLYYSGNYLK
ncbi:hypothetical protein [Alteromonas sp. a30]|uniref:hypothetical protein n=1 Tax=Alteromonas sp. a30 TaxID=2730917 RepID=UPI002281EABD|nr:hypothetical protein [Alteromonas sp. a30]MCY7294630.1 hypothetical protein [Alteromonas sp. a30]